MINLKITSQCVDPKCEHDLHLLPNNDVPGLYQATCAGCQTVYECIVLTPDELAWHDVQVVNAVTPEKAKK